MIPVSPGSTPSAPPASYAKASPSSNRLRISAHRRAGYSSASPSSTSSVRCRPVAAAQLQPLPAITPARPQISADSLRPKNRRKAAPESPAPHITRTFHVERVGYFRSLPRTAGGDFGRGSVSRNLYRARKRVRAGRQHLQRPRHSRPPRYAVRLRRYRPRRRRLPVRQRRFRKSRRLRSRPWAG